jgi:hypothetical protein
VPSIHTVVDERVVAFATANKPTRSRVPLQHVAWLMFRGVDEFMRVQGDNLSCHGT